jgi:predicted dehydrogenase
MSARPYRVAVIGDTHRGGYGHFLDTAFVGMENIEIVAVADRDRFGRQLAKIRTGAERDYDDYRLMLDQERPDLVAICPRWLDQRLAMVRAAAAVGAHIFIEKPFAPTIEDAEAMVDACRAAGSRIAVAHQGRLHPASLHVKHLLEIEQIGRLRLVRGLGKMDQRGGLQDLFVLGTHVLDLIRFLAGDAQWVTGEIFAGGRLATSNDLRDGGEGIGPILGDGVRMTFGLPNQVLGSFESYAGLAGNEELFGIEFVGEQSQLSLRGGLTKRLLAYPRPYIVPGAPFDRWVPIDVPGVEPGDVPGPHQYAEQELFERGNQRLIRDLIDAIETGRPAATSGEDAVKTVELIQAASAAHKLQRDLTLPLVDRTHPFAHGSSS